MRRTGTSPCSSSCPQSTSSKCATWEPREHIFRATSKPTQRSMVRERPLRTRTAAHLRKLRTQWWTVRLYYDRGTDLRSELHLSCGAVQPDRQFEHGFGFNVSYWFSKTLDYLSSMNLQGASAKALSGENDLAQNPFDLKAEHGPSIFDARNRFVASGMWEIPFARNSSGITNWLLDGWQLNGIATANSATPFTVYDSTNVSLQASSPPISGYFASRPNVIGDPTHGPHTVNQWISREVFQRLIRPRRPVNLGTRDATLRADPALPISMPRQ